MTDNLNAKIGAFDTVRVYLKENRALYGLLRWSTVVHTETIDTEVIVLVPKGTKVTVKEQDGTIHS